VILITASEIRTVLNPIQKPEQAGHAGFDTNFGGKEERADITDCRNAFGMREQK
jgi:hypothetical protein